jgi:hypothetical protein
LRVHDFQLRHAGSFPSPFLSSFPVLISLSLQAIDQIVNSAGKTYYMSGGCVFSPFLPPFSASPLLTFPSLRNENSNVPCPVVFRGPNGAAAGVGAQHSQDYAGSFTFPALLFEEQN